MATIRKQKKSGLTSPLTRDNKTVNYSSGDIHEQPCRTNPHEGYCLVFLRETNQYELSVEDQRLVAREKPNFDVPSGNWLTDYSHKIKHVEMDDEEKDNLLFKLKRSKAVYEIRQSPDGRHFVVLVSMSVKDAEQWADEHDIDIEIEPKEAVRAGRETPNFLLAHRTFHPEFDKENVLKDEAGEFPLLDLKLWENIHIPFEPAIDEKVYKIKGHGGSVLDNRLFLRILYEYMTADEGSGGCGLNIDAMLADTSHPLTSIYALNDPKNSRPELKIIDILKPSRESEERTVQEIREYYGEMIAFYFAFLLHYQRCLFFAVPLGVLFFIIQVSVGRIDIPGSLVLVIIALFWSTAAIETWYRRENALRFQWGMMRYSETEVPRPNFEGIIEISKVTGELIEVMSSRVWYVAKIMMSMSGIVCCLACVIAAVVGIWTLKSRTNNNEMSILIGMLNAVQITIFNYIYVYLAFWLNEREGHRLQEEWYNHLVIKRMFFFVVNSFNSLFYLAFVQDFPSNQQCLSAVRIQLVTLFLSMIFIQNTMEVFVPKMMIGLSTWCRKSQESESYQRLISSSPVKVETNVVRMDEMVGMAGDIVSNGTNNLETDAKNEDKNNQGLSRGELARLDAECRAADSHSLIRRLSVDEGMWDDAWKQLSLPNSPAVLDNTAEIVIQYGYIMLFVLVFPFMFAMAVINNFIEFRLDFYELNQSRRNVPYAASGIGVWKQVLSAFSTVAVFSNLAIVTWRTGLVKWHLTSSNETNKVIYFFVITFLLLLFQFIVRYAIPDVSTEIKDALERQETCEKYLLLGEVKRNARYLEEKHDSSEELVDS